MDRIKNNASGGEEPAKVEEAESGSSSCCDVDSSKTKTSEQNPIFVDDDDDDAGGESSSRVVTFEVMDSDEDVAGRVDNDAGDDRDGMVYFQLTQPDPSWENNPSVGEEDDDGNKKDQVLEPAAQAAGKRSAESNDARDGLVPPLHSFPRARKKARSCRKNETIGSGPGKNGQYSAASSASRTSVTTRVYLLMDRSGSMRERDVATTSVGFTGAGDRRKAPSSSAMNMTRYDSVFRAAAELVEAQSALHGSSIDFSLMLWSDLAEWVFRGLNAKACLDGLERARRSRPPGGGTNFSDPFRLLRDAVGSGDGEETATSSSKSQHRPPPPPPRAVVVFLSDGRPGDLRARPPDSHEAIQRTYASHGRRHDSIAVHLEASRGRMAALHFVGIHESGFPWLRCLAERYDGHFHGSSLELGPQVGVAPPTATSTAAESGTSREEDAGSQSSDEDDVEFLRSISAEERIRRNVVAAEVFTVQSQTQSSIRDTFFSLSQSITDVHETASQRARWG